MTHSPIDKAVFTELQDSVGSEFVGELVDTFLEELPGMLAELRTAYATADTDNFRRAAHSIKSNANIFGAVNLAERARELELKGLDAATDDRFAALNDAGAQATTALIELKDA